ncbi:MAG: DUF4367 domain-containing protein [Clostridia bacterium]|nr:DUF4367 domain-containing protein [Clostridia bacterium]
MNTKQTSADMRVDSMIRLALLEIAEEKWQEIEALDTSDVVISERHDKRMRRLFQRGASASQRNKTAKRIVLSILVALAVLAMLGMAIRPVRQAFTNAIVTWYKDFFKVELQTDEDSEHPKTIETVRFPVLLEGWEKEILHESEFSRAIRYNNKDGMAVDFSQMVFSDDQFIGIDDHYDIKEIGIHGYSAMLFESEARETRILTWDDGEYLYQVDGKIPAELLIQIAESVE